MKKVAVLLLSTVMLLTPGCFNDKHPENPAVATSQLVQAQEKEKPKTLESSNAGTKLEKTYQPTTARSNQNITAIFEIGSKTCVIQGKRMIMEAPVVLTDYGPYVPARYFALAIGIPNGEYTLSKVTHRGNLADQISFSNNHKTVTGVWKQLTIQDNTIGYLLDKDVIYVDDTGISYINLSHFSRACGFDMFLDKRSGKIELLEGLPLEEDDLVIASSMRPRMKERKFINLLGNPESVIDNGVKERRESFYKGISFYTAGPKDEAEVCVITVTSPVYKTRRGITVGDSIEKVVKFYGMGYQFFGKINGYRYSFLSSFDHDKSIMFTVEDGKVKEIMIADYYTQ